MKWQKRARLGVATFGVVCAIAVYAAIGERRQAAPPSAPARLDPKAMIESEGAQVQQERGAQRDFQITSDRNLVYQDGSTVMVGVTIRVTGRQGRDFVLKGQEARAGANRSQLELSGAVELEASDGFRLQADRGSFDQEDGIVRAPGEVIFSKGRMSGAGVGMTYDETNDVLSLTERARVTMLGEDEEVALAFESTSAVVNRTQDVVTLDGAVRAQRGEQLLAGDRAVARLTPTDDAVTFIELRGNATVSGGDTAVDSMSARDIDLDYTEDGELLERIRLAGGGALALKGENGDGGRQMMGETLDLQMAADGSLTSVTGRDSVQLDLPASEGTSARSVKAKALDATGEPGRSLTQARFTEDVEYREAAERGSTPRSATSRALRISLDGNAISAAVFSGSVIFDQQGLRASGAEARYEPGAGTLQITGTDTGGPPRVADEQITIEAQKSIDVTLADRRMKAIGPVKTTLRSRNNSRLPGLLKGEEPANVNADALQYDGGGKAVYTGRAELWQGQTAIRADAITLDQQNGDLLALGAARSTLPLDDGTSTGRAAEIRFDDASRVISYLSHLPVAPRGAGAAPAAPPAGAAAAVQVLLSVPQGQIQADRVEIVLAKQGSRIDRLEAYTNVTARVDTRVATGARLTYFAADERYVMTGANAVPVKVVERCRETSGKTLTFFKTADRIIVDGNEEIRTQTRSGGPCAAGPPAR